MRYNWSKILLFLTTCPDNDLKVLYFKTPFVLILCKMEVLLYTSLSVLYVTKL